jgi:DNA primase
VWFNEPALNLPGWVIVCEGQMDVMRVVQSGHAKVVGNLTAKPTDIKLEKLLHAWGTLLIPDNDETGDISIARYKAFHKKYNQPLRVLNLPDGVKDPDDCHHEFLKTIIDERLN